VREVEKSIHLIRAPGARAPARLESKQLVEVIHENEDMEES
jgi:hypothetical protein